MKKQRIILSLLLFLLCAGAGFLCFSASRTVTAIHQELSEKILRFHILANSDSDEDQALKLTVKAAVLHYIEENLPEDSGLEETKAFLKAHKTEIQKTAEAVIEKEGFDYPVSLFLEPWYFPTKVYGDLTFPCGTYEAFRIVIGDGAGKNWWCVLYPSLCFVDAAWGVVPEESKEELRTILDEDTYAALQTEDRSASDTSDSSPKEIRVRFRLIEWLEGLF